MDEEEHQLVSLIRERKHIQMSEIRIWPIWSKSKISKVALPPVTPDWLIPTTTLDVNVNQDFQLDMLITPRAFLF